MTTSMPSLPTRALCPRLLRTCTLVALGWLLAAAASAAGFDLDALMRTLGTVKSGEASFVEERQVRELDQPQVSSGRLSFEAPGVFVRETLKPRNEKLAVDGNTLVMSRGSRNRTVALDSVPQAQVLVEAIRGTLTGDRDALERHFTVRLEGSLARWTLDLAPKDSRLRQQVIAIRVTGRQSLLDEVQVDLPGGDRSVMRITPSAAPAGRP